MEVLAEPEIDRISTEMVFESDGIKEVDMIGWNIIETSTSGSRSRLSSSVKMKVRVLFGRNQRRETYQSQSDFVLAEQLVQP